MRRKGIFGGAQAPLWRTTMDDLNILGVGITMYFRMIKYIAIGFVIMSILVVPTLYLCATGHRIANGDILTLSSLSLGNTGPVRRLLIALSHHCCVHACFMSQYSPLKQHAEKTLQRLQDAARSQPQLSSCPFCTNSSVRSSFTCVAEVLFTAVLYSVCFSVQSRQRVHLRVRCCVRSHLPGHRDAHPRPHRGGLARSGRLQCEVL